jgi:hypothetical protein
MAHTTGPRPNNDTNYGVVGDKTLRTAAQIGNESGQADFNQGPSTDQTLRVILAEGSQVGITTVGNGVFAFSELAAVPVGTPTQLVAYIPAVNHTLKRVVASGMADAEFDLKINGAVVARKRNNWTDRNVEFSFGEQGIPVTAGQTIELVVLSNGDSACPFDASIFGEES